MSVNLAAAGGSGPIPLKNVKHWKVTDVVPDRELEWLVRVNIKFYTGAPNADGTEEVREVWLNIVDAAPDRPLKTTTVKVNAGPRKNVLDFIKHVDADIPNAATNVLAAFHSVSSATAPGERRSKAKDAVAAQLLADGIMDPASFTGG